MFDFRKEDSVVYRKGILYMQFTLLISLILTNIFKNTEYLILDRFLWFLRFASSFIGLMLLGTRDVIAKKRKIGYIYYLVILIFGIAFLVF